MRKMPSRLGRLRSNTTTSSSETALLAIIPLNWFNWRVARKVIGCRLCSGAAGKRQSRLPAAPLENSAGAASPPAHPHHIVHKAKAASPPPHPHHIVHNAKPEEAMLCNPQPQNPIPSPALKAH